MTGPTLLAARDALARAICEWNDEGATLPGEPMPCSSCTAQADALLASGVVQTPASYVAGLAEDEALVERVADRLAVPEPVGDSARKFARIALHALADALGGGE